MSEQRCARPSPIAELAVFTFGLAVLDTWGDLKGAAAVLAPFNQFIEGALVNGRMIGLSGIALVCALAVIRPGWMVRANFVLRAAVPALAVTLSASYFVIPVQSPIGVVGILAVFMSGMCYGWFEVKLLGLLATVDASLFDLVMASGCALGVKAVAVPLVSIAPGGLQSVLFVLLPLAMGLACVWCDRRLALLPEPVSTRRALTLTPATAAVLVLFSILGAAARGTGSFGFWGGDNVVGMDSLGPSLLAAALFMLAAYASLVRCGEARFISVSIKLMPLLLLGFLAEGSGLTSSALLPAYLTDTLGIFMDLYAIFLLHVAIVATARTSSIHPFSAAGLGDAAMCLASIVFGLFLTWFPGSEATVVLTATFCTAVVALLMVEKTVERKPQEPYAEPGLGERCAGVAQTYGLTARESEVLHMLAQGRSQTFIANELSLAPSTVKTHTKHVYQKLGVSSKQELISLTDSFRGSAQRDINQSI